MDLEGHSKAGEGAELDSMGRFRGYFDLEHSYLALIFSMTLTNSCTRFPILEEEAGFMGSQQREF